MFDPDSYEEAVGDMLLYPPFSQAQPAQGVESDNSINTIDSTILDASNSLTYKLFLLEGFIAFIGGIFASIFFSNFYHAFSNFFTAVESLISVIL